MFNLMLLLSNSALADGVSSLRDFFNNTTTMRAQFSQVVNHLKAMGEPNYIEGILTNETEGGGDIDGMGNDDGGEKDPLYDEAVGIVLKSRRASISSVQRQLRIGYNRAARLIEDMERAGLVSSMQSNGNREVLAKGSMSHDE